MAGEWSGPWDGIVVGDAAVLAPYSSADWARIWRSLIQSGGINEGVLVGSGIAPDTGLSVLANGTAGVDVTPGSAIVNGTWYQMYGLLNQALTIDPNASGNPRIDRIVLRASYAAQTVRLAVLKGTPAGSPAAPALTQVDGTTWEIPLARIAVANGFATIVQANITPEWAPGGAAEGVYLTHILNHSGADLDTGDVVVWDYTVDRAVKTGTSIGAIVAGIWVGPTASGSYGRVLTEGIIPVKTTGAITKGMTLEHSATAKTAQQAGSQDTMNSFATAVAITAGNYTLCHVHVAVEQMKFLTNVVYVPGAPIQDNSGNWVDVDGVNVNVTGRTHTGRLRITFSFTGAIAAANTGCFRIYNFTSSVAYGDATQGLAATHSNQGEHITVSWLIYSGLALGTNYQFRLQFKSLTGTDMVTVTADPIVKTAEEV